MEDVLRVYEQLPQAGMARLCFDERPCQLLDEVLAPLPLQEGKPLRQDYEYERKGTACVLLAYDLDSGQRYVQVRKTRTKKDYAQFMAWLVRTHYWPVTQLQIVQDNLNTHQMSSFYEHLPVEEAGTLAAKMRFHSRPQAWLLAEHSRDRIQCFNQTMLGPAPQRYRNVRNPSAGLVPTAP